MLSLSSRALGHIAAQYAADTESVPRTVADSAVTSHVAEAPGIAVGRAGFAFA